MKETRKEWNIEAMFSLTPVALMKFPSIRIATLALYAIASAASSYSDNEYVPPAYNEEYFGTIHFRHQLRHYGIPTRFLHDPNVSPDAMVLAFYDMPSGYMNYLPNERRKRDNFAKDLAAYLGAHRSEGYKNTFRRLRDKLLMARRARKAHEKRVMMNIRQPVKEKILTGQPIADYDLEQTEESRQILNEIIERDLIESGIVVKDYAPEALAVVMQKQLRYFDKFDPDELKKVIRRISAYMRDTMSDNYEFLWKKKLHLYKRTAHHTSVDATMEQLQPREGVFSGVGFTDDNWHGSNIVYAEPQADHQGAERQLQGGVAIVNGECCSFRFRIHF